MKYRCRQFPGDFVHIRQHQLAVDTLNISRRFTLTRFLGPQYSESQGLVPVAPQPTQSSKWSVAGGAEGGWKNQRTSVSAGYSRSISDGGGVLGAVRLQTVHADFRRELLRVGRLLLPPATERTNRLPCLRDQREFNQFDFSRRLFGA